MRVHPFHQFSIAQQHVAQHRGQVLQCHRGGQLNGTGRLLHQFQQPHHHRIHGFNGHTRRHQGFVVFLVLTGVEAFLADEGGNLFLQMRVGDFLAIVAHALDKEALPRRKENRQGVIELGDMQPARIPAQCLAGGQPEFEIPAYRINLNCHCHAP